VSWANVERFAAVVSLAWALIALSGWLIRLSRHPKVVDARGQVTKDQVRELLAWSGLAAFGIVVALIPRITGFPWPHWLNTVLVTIGLLAAIAGVPAMIIVALDIRDARSQTAGRE
jgi:hypothetical protein